MKKSLINIFEILLLKERYHQNCQTVFAAEGMDELTYSNLKSAHNLTHVEISSHQRNILKNI